MRFALIFAAALLGWTIAGAPARADAPPVLRIGWVVVPSDLAPLMFTKPGLAPHAGKTYTPRLIHFTGTSSILTALANGSLDCAALAYSTFALGIENAGMSDLRVIADSFQDGVPGYHTNSFYANDNSAIHTIEDLKGKVLATNEVGSAIDMALRAMLAQHGLKDKRDLTIVEVPFPSQIAMLQQGKVDLISAVAPFGFDPRLNSIGFPLFSQSQAIGRTQMIMRVARAGFLKSHHAMMVDFMEDYLHTLHYLSDPAHHDEAVALIAKATKQPASLYASWVFTKSDYYRDPNALPDLGALQANVDMQQRLGFLKAHIDVTKYADLSLAREAAQRLGAQAKQ